MWGLYNEVTAMRSKAGCASTSLSIFFLSLNGFYLQSHITREPYFLTGTVCLSCTSHGSNCSLQLKRLGINCWFSDVGRQMTYDSHRDPRFHAASRHRIFQATGSAGFMQFHALIFVYRTNSFRINGSQIIFLCPFFPRQSHFYILTGSVPGRPNNTVSKPKEMVSGGYHHGSVVKCPTPQGTLAGQVRNCSGDHRKCSRFHRQTCNQKQSLRPKHLEQQFGMLSPEYLQDLRVYFTEPREGHEP